MLQSKYKMNSILAILTLATMSISCENKVMDREEPIHLDDIHFIVTNEEATVEFFQKHFGAREMAHPGDRFDLVRFLSLKWQGPTITITSIGPYVDLPPERNQRWLDAKIISPKSEIEKPTYGVKWLAISTASIAEARKELLASGAQISKDKISLPLEPNTKAFSIYGPDGFEIVIVERPDGKFGDSKYAIDHIQFLIKDIEKTQAFFKEAFSASLFKREKRTIGLKVADARLLLSEPEEFGIKPKNVSPRKAEGIIRIGLDHLGFLYSDINQAAKQAKENGQSPIFQPQRYIYKNKPTVYTFTSFVSPDNFNVEMVQADGRIGPHSYYMNQN